MQRSLSEINTDERVFVTEKTTRNERLVSRVIYVVAKFQAILDICSLIIAQIFYSTRGLAKSQDILRFLILWIMKA